MTTSTPPIRALEAEKGASSASRRIPELDGLRGLAILSVLVYHYLILEGAISAWPVGEAIGMFGWTGVDLFFVLSGFLIGGILLDARDTSPYFKPFYLRRAFRILPLYVVLCAVAAVVYVSGVTRETPAHSWLYDEKVPWFAYATFAQNIFMAAAGSMSSRMIDATWSLAIEEQFYLTFPLVVRFAPKRWLPWILAAAALAAPLIRAALGYSLPPGHRTIAVYALMPCRADALLVGVLIAWAVRDPEWRTWLVGHRRTLYGSIFLFGVGFAALVANHWGPTSPHLATWGYSVIALFFGGVLTLAVVHSSGWLGWALRRRYLMATGTVAYGLYLFHQPVLGLTHLALRGETPALVDSHALGTTLLASVILVALCRASWVWFERPLIRIGHRWRFGSEPAGAQASDHPSTVSPNTTTG